MKKKIKRIFKKIKRQLKKILSKKVSIYEVIITLVLIALIIGIIIFLKGQNKYYYIDTSGNRGVSEKCYAKVDGLYCDITVAVKQYSEY